MTLLRLLTGLRLCLKTSVLFFPVGAIFLLSLSCFVTKKDSLKPREEFHAVIQSNGYSQWFCLYATEVNPDMQTCNSRNFLQFESCQEISLDKNFPEFTAKENMTLLIKKLSELELKHPRIRNRLNNITFLSTSPQSTSPDIKNITQDLENFIKIENEERKKHDEKAPQINGNVKVLSSEEESKVVFSILKKRKPDDNQNQGAAMPLALLQIGPESLDLLYSVNPQAEKDSPIFSDKIGIRTLNDSISNIKPDYYACKQPLSNFFKTTLNSFENCKSFLFETLSKSAKFQSLLKSKPDLENAVVYSTGSTWNEIFPGKKIIKLVEIEKKGLKYCKLSIPEILKEGISKQHAIDLCYTISYKAVLMETLGILKVRPVSNTEYWKEITSQPQFFSSCKF